MDRLTMVMAEQALYRLLTWLSPSYPVGAYAYSHGLEWAVETGRVRDEATLQRWIEQLMVAGSGWSDAVLFACAHDCAGDEAALADLNQLALALAPSKERALETEAQGKAFLQITLEAWPWPGCEALALGPKVAYPVAVAIAASGHGIARQPALSAYCHGLAANLVSAGVRLIPLGQSAGQRITAALEHPISQTVRAACAAGADDIGGSAVVSDIASMAHETQRTRLFRS
ncbi:MAG: urease accessory protein UreF [Pseudomonadota bacterium]